MFQLTINLTYINFFQIRASLVPTEDWGPRLYEDRTGRYDPKANYITPCTIQESNI